MKQSNNLDAACIGKIIKYIRIIGDIYAKFDIDSADDLADSSIARLAITQAITNIHELNNKIQDETLARIPLFGRVRLKAARNIASHDYDSLDFNIIYKRACQLLKQEVVDELEAAKNDIGQDSTSD